VSTYPMPVITRAREHHAAEWTPTEIRRLLRDEFGVNPALSTVKMWVNEGYAESRRRDGRARMRSRPRRLGRTREAQVAFAMRLRARGVPATSVEKVLAELFDNPLSAYHVRVLADEAVAA